PRGPAGPRPRRRGRPAGRPPRSPRPPPGPAGDPPRRPPARRGAARARRRVTDSLPAPRPLPEEPAMRTTDLPTGSGPEVAPVASPGLGPGADDARAADLDLLADVDLVVTVGLGRVRLKVRDLLRLGEGSVVELDRAAGAAVDVLVNGSLVARGDVVVVDDELGVRITELLKRTGG